MAKEIENELLEMMAKKKSCKDCGWGMYFPGVGTVVCGVHYTSFSASSLCDDFLTEEQREAVNKIRHEEFKKRKGML